MSTRVSTRVGELHYTYRVEWSPEDGEWVGLVAEFPSLSWLSADPVEALQGIRDVVGEVVVDMGKVGETVPEPLSERRYSGKVFVRTSPELHRRLTIEAAEQGVSVNQWAMQKLAERDGGLLAALQRIDSDTAGHLRELLAAPCADDDAPPTRRLVGEVAPVRQRKPRKAAARRTARRN